MLKQRDMSSANWIKLLDNAPTEYGIYKCLSLGYDKEWDIEFLEWTDEGFQPLDYGQPEKYAINMNVSHWLKVEHSEPPILEAEKLIIETEVFFYADGLEHFTKSHDIGTFCEYGNAAEFIISNVPITILIEMRTKFKSNGTHFNIRKS